jgi:asparagine synthase (glutamine-hydrolysing)
MTGKFGSEIVRSNSLLTKPLRLWNGLFEKDFLPRIEAGEEALSRSRKCNPLTFAAFKEVPWHEFGRLAVEQSKLTLRTPYMNNDIVELMYRAPRGLRASDDIPLHVVGEGNKALMNIVTDRGQGGTANRIITWFRRAGRYAQFKTEYLYLFQLPPALVRLDALLDPLHFDRRFFSRYQLLHYGKLFRNELSGYIRDILTDRETLTRPYLYKDTVKHLVEGHLRGRQNFYNEINKLLTVELVHRQFNIG